MIPTILLKVPLIQATSTNTATDANVSTTNNVVTDEKSSEFLKKVTNAGMAEIQLAKAGATKSDNRCG